ncbi:MAG: transposase, partial [Bacteroidaceae bacterium]|nr:transposase [Bacteroidaceae bacterium]
MDTYPITARSLEKFFFIDGDLFERAYKNHLSDFRRWKPLPHAESWLTFHQNIGPRVSIDETALSDGELYTIVSNKEAHGRKGAIIAIVKGTKVEDVRKALKTILWNKRAKVLEVTMDFSESMRAVVKECFPYAIITIDLFHLIKEVVEALQQLRIKHKHEAQRKEVEAREQFKHRNKRNALLRKMYAASLKVEGKKKSTRGRKPNRRNEQFKPERLSNGDTLTELLTRSRYLLMVSADKWTESQQTRARLLFDRYPDIKTAYGLVHGLRRIFSNRKATIESGKKSLGEWYNKVTEFDDKNFNTVASTIFERQGEILNYFLHHETNASAESLNSKIKCFRAQVKGV